MPQMKPLLWWYLMMLVISMFLIMSIFIYNKYFIKMSKKMLLNWFKKYEKNF